MKLRPSPLVKSLLPGLSLGFLFSGCSAPQPHPKTATHDYAYIEYWPPNEKSGRLRLAVKDLIDMKGVLTTAGSEFLAKHSKPAERDAACLAIARQRNVQIVGKTNTTELAVAVSGINQYYGTPRNPVTHRRRLIPGGSSSGSAVAVASGSADVAFGTDTAGSIRVPAACCGVVGLKTTFGLVPLDGVYPISPTRLDTVGPMAKDVAGTVKGMDLLESGFAAKYRSAVAAHSNPARIRVGRLYIKGTDPKVDRAIDEALAKTGFTVVPMSKAFQEAWDQAQKDANTVAASNAWISDLKFRHESEVTVRTKLIVAVGQYQYQSNYKDALGRTPGWQDTVARALQQVDFIAVPTLRTLPPSVPWLGGTAAFEARVIGLQNTQAVNLAGNPALALPVPVQDRAVPVTSLQLIGPDRGEAELLNAGRLVEAANPPPLPKRRFFFW